MEHRRDRRPTVIELGQRADDLSLLLLETALFDESPHGVWLRTRYAEIVPVVLPDALRCIGTGERLSISSLDCVRSSARACHRSDVPLTVALRGGVPALRAFSALVQSFEGTVTLRETTVLMGRAALIAQELGACWVEAWTSPVTETAAEPAADPRIEIVTRAARDDSGVDEASPVLDMVALAAGGASTEQIASATDYSTQAVKWHLGRLMKSWQVANRAGLVGAAFARGVLVARRRPRL